MTRYRQFSRGGNFDVVATAFYIEDEWTIAPLNATLRLGLRNERFDNRNVQGQSIARITDQFAPRIGFSWDVGGNRNSKIFANYGRYHLPVGSVINIFLGSPWSSTEGWYVLDQPIDGDGSLDELRLSAEELGFPSMKRRYKAVTLDLQRRWDGVFYARASYTWSQSYGNYEGTVRSDTGEDLAGAFRPPSDCRLDSSSREPCASACGTSSDPIGSSAKGDHYEFLYIGACAQVLMARTWNCRAERSAGMDPGSRGAWTNSN